MKKEAADITLFNEPVASGALHPVMATMDKIIEYFLALNFSLETGPLIEDDFHNFEALNYQNTTQQGICKIHFT